MSLDNTVNVFILYGCTLSKERSSMRIVAATTDEEMLHTIIGAQILGGTMDYRGFSNMKGFEQFRAACRAGNGCNHLRDRRNRYNDRRTAQR